MQRVVDFGKGHSLIRGKTSNEQDGLDYDQNL